MTDDVMQPRPALLHKIESHIAELVMHPLLSPAEEQPR